MDRNEGFVTNEELKNKHSLFNDEDENVVKCVQDNVVIRLQGSSFVEAMELEQQALDKAIAMHCDHMEEEAGKEVLEALATAMQKGCNFIVPVELSHKPKIDDDVQVGDEYTIEQDISFRMPTLDTEEESFFTAFTSYDEFKYGLDSNTVTVPIGKVLEKTLFNENVSGLIINHFNNQCIVNKNQIMKLFIKWLDNDTSCRVCFLAAELHATDAEAAFEPVNGSYEIEAKEVFGVDNPICNYSDESYNRLYECYWKIFNQAYQCGYKYIAVANMGIIGGYPEHIGRKIATTAMLEWNTVHRFAKMRIMLICGNKERSQEYNDHWTILNDCVDYNDVDRSLNMRKLQDGLQLGMELYDGKVMPATHQPCLLYALSQMQLLQDLELGTDMLLAALLHNAVELELIDIDTLVKRYGLDMAALTDSLLRDKDKPWVVRQFQQIYNLRQTEDDRLPLLAMAEAIVDMRYMYDCCKSTRYYWMTLDAPKDYQELYYKRLLEELQPFALKKSSERIYQEYMELYKALFMI